MDEATVDPGARLRAQQLTSQLNHAGAQLAQLEEKIARLQAAQARVRELLSTVNDTVLGHPYADDFDGEWKGQLRRKWDDGVREDLQVELRRYWDGLCVLDQHMGERMKTLANEHADLASLAVRLTSQLDAANATVARAGGGW